MTDGARVAVGLRAVRYDLSGTPSTANAARLPHGLDAAYREDVPVAGPGSIRTRGGALDLFETWVDDWAERCDDHDGAHDTLGYLRSHTLWAALNHPAWHDYLSELRTTRAVVRRLAGLAPEREPAPCVHCGGTIVRDWTTWEGLSDITRCTGCGTTRGVPCAPRAHEEVARACAAGEAARRARDRGAGARDLAALEPGDVALLGAPRGPGRRRDGRGRPLFELGAVAARVEAVLA